MVLWPDTLHQLPWRLQVGRAAVEVLEAAGYEVVLPDRPGVLRADLDLDRPAEGRARSASNRSLADARAAARGRYPDRRVSNRVALRCSDGTQPICCRRPLAGTAAHVDAHLRRVARPSRAGSRRRVGRRRWCRRIATSTPSRLRRRSRADGRRPGIDANVPDSGAAGWPATSASNAATTTCRKAIGERVLLPAVREAAPEHRRTRRRLQLPHPDRARHPAASRPPGRTARRCALDSASSRSAVSA